MRCPRRNQSRVLALFIPPRIFRNHFYFANKRCIEGSQILGWNPILAMGFAARLVNLIRAQKPFAHAKPSDVIPTFTDLD